MASYAIIYPWAVMCLAVIAASASLIGGALTGLAAARQSAAANEGPAMNIFSGFFTFIASCGAAMFCLFLGGKLAGSI